MDVDGVIGPLCSKSTDDAMVYSECPEVMSILGRTAVFMEKEAAKEMMWLIQSMYVKELQ
jgi:hypothetical protein